MRPSNWTARQKASPLLSSAGPWTASPSQVGAQPPLCECATHNLKHSVCVLTCVCFLCFFFLFFLTATDKDPRRSLTAGGSLILKDVNFGDTAIYQCQASNKHGTILVNANVYVIGECLLYTCHLFNSFLCVYFCVCVCVSHIFLCVLFQSCLPRSWLRTWLCTHLQRGRRLHWIVRPLALPNLKSYGETLLFRLTVLYLIVYSSVLSGRFYISHRWYFCIGSSSFA